jgi:hypothetical protein
LVLNNPHAFEADECAEEINVVSCVDLGADLVSDTRFVWRIRKQGCIGERKRWARATADVKASLWSKSLKNLRGIDEVIDARVEGLSAGSICAQQFDELVDQLDASFGVVIVHRADRSLDERRQVLRESGRRLGRVE